MHARLFLSKLYMCENNNYQSYYLKRIILGIEEHEMWTVDYRTEFSWYGVETHNKIQLLFSLYMSCTSVIYMLDL